MKKLSLTVFLVLMLSLNINVSAWEKVPIPNYIDKKTKSPWNFFDDLKFPETPFLKPICKKQQKIKT